MKAGDLLLFKASSGISKLIAWGTNSKYSHVAVCVNAEMNLVIEAQGRVRAQDIRKMKDYDVYRVKSGYVYDLNDVVSFLVSKLNNKYDYAGVVYLGVLKLLAKLRLPLKDKANAWQRKKDYFCSELAAEAFRVGWLDIVPKVGDEVTSPADIANSEVMEVIQ